MQILEYEKVPQEQREIIIRLIVENKNGANDAELLMLSLQKEGRSMADYILE